MAKIAFRADASLQIGTGHVMRCLALAYALRGRGHECLFICREHPGNLLGLLKGEGFSVQALPVSSSSDENLSHAQWLGASQSEDAQACKELLATWSPDWLVVDHYALDHNWERCAPPHSCRVLVIDDLADRQHICHVLLDQNLGRCDSDYQNLLPQNCITLIGPRYALLRSEFSALRQSSLSRRKLSGLDKILISLGGVDQFNYTHLILIALQSCDLPENLRLSVVLGPTAPHLKSVMDTASQSRWPVEVLSGVRDMALRLADADLVIGAAGSSSWERCCLGVPTLLLTLAENQKRGGLALAKTGAALLIDPSGPLESQLQDSLAVINDPVSLRQLSQAASHVTDGLGSARVVACLEGEG